MIDVHFKQDCTVRYMSSTNDAPSVSFDQGDSIFDADLLLNDKYNIIVKTGLDIFHIPKCYINPIAL